MAEMAVERWTPERRRELTRSALIDAAGQVFAQRGFYGASLDEIAEAAGFTRGAIYKNFEDKEGLFLATIDRRAQRRLAAFSEWFDELIEQGATDVPGAADLAGAFRRIMAQDTDWYALDLEARLYALRNPEFRDRYIATYRRTSEAVTRFMEDLSTSAGFTMTLPPARLARMFEVASEGFIAWAALDPEEAELFESFFDLLLNAVTDEQH